MQKKYLLSLLTGLGLLVLATPVVAEDCVTQYGNGGYGETKCVPSDLTVNKKVRTPIAPFEFRENLNEGDLKYGPDGDVVFSIAITNNGSQTFEEVKVEDLLPEYIVSASVPGEYNGSYNSSDRRLTFYVKDLHTGETKTVEVTAKIAKNGFPQNQSVTCQTNKVEVRSEERYAEDHARYCIQTSILGTTTLPQAGIGDYLPLMPFAALSFGGLMLILKKRSV